jgi:hypothetical protein
MKKQKDYLTKDYRVSWEIDVYADNPEDAAKEARSCQAPGTTALVFSVCDKISGTITEIDLEKDPLSEKEEEDYEK